MTDKQCKKCLRMKQALITAWSEKMMTLNPNLKPQQARNLAIQHYYDLIAGKEDWLNGEYPRRPELLMVN